MARYAIMKLFMLSCHCRVTDRRDDSNAFHQGKRRFQAYSYSTTTYWKKDQPFATNNAKKNSTWGRRIALGEESTWGHPQKKALGDTHKPGSYLAESTWGALGEALGDTHHLGSTWSTWGHPQTRKLSCPV